MITEIVLAHGGEFHPITLLAILGAMFIPAAGILTAVLIAGRRSGGEPRRRGE